MLAEAIQQLAASLLFMTEEEAQIFLEKNYPNYLVEVHDDHSATITGPDEFELIIKTLYPNQEDGEA